ncbi:MAG: hypothetical protein GY905_06045, partial [Gammaproteobacteria bacterium]|nr:hypothetical protein [Gammaproteobacteria bacterium]
MGFVSDIVSSVFDFGASDAADAQVESAQQGIDFQQQMFNQMQQNTNPFMQFGTGMLPSLQMAMNPLDSDQLMADYLKSGEYAMMSDQARQGQAAQNEAMGLMGSSAGANAMASITPQLATQYMGRKTAEHQDQYNRVANAVNMGLNAATGTGQAGMNMASQAAG